MIVWCSICVSNNVIFFLLFPISQIVMGYSVEAVEGEIFIAIWAYFFLVCTYLIVLQVSVPAFCFYYLRRVPGTFLHKY